jgi:hypothetical protein
MLGHHEDKHGAKEGQGSAVVAWGRGRSAAAPPQITEKRQFRIDSGKDSDTWTVSRLRF